MRVKVVSQAGMASLVGVEAGDVKAYLLTGDQDKDLSEAESVIGQEADLKVSQKNKSRSRSKMKEDQSKWMEIRQAKEKQKKIEDGAIVFLDTNNIKVELDRPENIFLPQQASRPQKRLEKEQAHMEAMKKIKSQIRILRLARVTESKVIPLELLLANVEKEKSGNWRNIIRNCLEKMKSKGFFYRDNDCITFLEDLKNIVETDSTSGSSSKKNPAQEKPTDKKKSVITTVKGFFGDGAQEQPELELQQTKRDSVPMPEEMVTAIRQIRTFVALLEAEKQNRPKILTRFFPSAKTVKIDVLKQLATDMNNLYENKLDKSTPIRQEEWVVLIDEAVAADKTKKSEKKGLMAHRLSNRTVNLLQNIRDGHAARGILKPPKAGKEEKVWKPSKKPTKRFL
jgi:hypothetical protein